MQMCEGTTDICDVAGYLLLPKKMCDLRPQKRPLAQTCNQSNDAQSGVKVL